MSVYSTDDVTPDDSEAADETLVHKSPDYSPQHDSPDGHGRHSASNPEPVTSSQDHHGGGLVVGSTAGDHQASPGDVSGHTSHSSPPQPPAKAMERGELGPSESSKHDTAFAGGLAELPKLSVVRVAGAKRHLKHQRCTSEGNSDYASSSIDYSLLRAGGQAGGSVSDHGRTEGSGVEIIKPTVVRPSGVSAQAGSDWFDKKTRNDTGKA